MTSSQPPDPRAVLDALPEAVLVVDTAGRVLETNAAARQALRLDLAASPPDLTALCPPLSAALAPSLLEHLAAAARGEAQELDWSFAPLAGPPLHVHVRLNRLDDEERVVVSFVRVVPARGRPDGAPGAAADEAGVEILPDEVDAFLGRFQNVAAELMERERTMSWGMRAVIDAADELVRCEDLDTVCRRGVELARERLGLERCGLFLLAADRQHVLGTYGTDMDGHTSDEHQGRVAVAEHPELVNPPGGLWTVMSSTEHTYWSGDEHHVVGKGWVACTLIRSVAGPIGVFYNDTARSGAPLNEALQETVAVYCSLLGNVIERRRSEEREHAMARSLNGILEATDELIGHSDPDTFYRRAVELAREKLNVERGAIFLLDPARQELSGTYGTDDEGRTTDERHARWPTSERPELFASNERWLYSDGPLAFWRGTQQQVVGAGWCALTFIRVGSEPIGVFSNDNALSQTPADDVTQEAIALYCSMLGHMLRRMRVEAEREKLIGELEAKNAELERFTYSVSHDLKSPLITIRGFLGFLEQDAVSGNVERLRADIQRIAEAASKMHRLLDELLELSRIGRIVNPPEDVAFAEIAREAVELLQGRIQQTGVTVEIAPDLPAVWGDRARLVEVVQNLVDNAAKFSGGQGTPRVEIGAQRFDGATVLFVRDNGIGVEPRFHQTIFGLFNKLDAKSEGTGVGLALVKRIIEVHGGRIWVESSGTGRGATFYFTLAPRPAVAPPTSTTAAGTAGIQ